MNERKSRGGVGGHCALAAGSRGNATKCKSIFPHLHQLIFLFFCVGSEKRKEQGNVANERSLSNHVPTELT